MTAKQNGSTVVELVECPKQCGRCAGMNGQFIDLDYLIEKFKRGRPEFPHEIYHDDAAIWCEGPFFRPNIPPRDGDDPDFHAWLIQQLKN